MTPVEQPTFLTIREFDLWRTEHDKKVDRILNFTETYRDAAVTNERLLRGVAVATESRLTNLEVNQENAGKLAARMSGIVAAAVAAAVSAAIGFIGGQR